MLQSVQSYSSKNWTNLRLLPDPRRFAAWEFLYRNTCLQNAHLETPINFFIVNMAMSDLLFAILLLPRELTYLYADSWLISGPVGQALCKLVPFLADVSFGVSIQSLVMMAVDQIWSCPISSPFPSHQFKAVPLLHSRHVDHRNGSIFAIFSRLQTCCVTRTTPLLVAVE